MLCNDFFDGDICLSKKIIDNSGIILRTAINDKVYMVLLKIIIENISSIYQFNCVEAKTSLQRE
jgi:hypothetical protein